MSLVNYEFPDDCFPHQLHQSHELIFKMHLLFHHHFIAGVNFIKLMEAYFIKDQGPIPSRTSA